MSSLVHSVSVVSYLDVSVDVVRVSTLQIKVIWIDAVVRAVGMSAGGGGAVDTHTVQFVIRHHYSFFRLLPMYVGVVQCKRRVE